MVLGPASWFLSCAHVPAPAPAPAPAATAAPAGPAHRDLSTDRATFFGASRCDKANVLLCEDFESGTLDPAIWQASGTPPTIETTQKARGARALHVVRDGNGLSRIRETKTFPVPHNRYYGRAFVRFEALPKEPMTYSHWTIIAGTGTGVRGEIRIGGQLQRGANRWGVGTDNRTPEGTGDWTNSDKDPAGQAMPVPEQQWMCIEWMHDGEHNETRLWWDGIEHPTLATTTDKHGGRKDVPYVLPTFDAVWLGWHEYQPSTLKFDMWLDEIAIDKDRIGCVL